MIEYCDSEGAYLYHYTSAETARKILDSGALKLARFRNTNDPKESKDWHFSVGARTNTGPDHPTAQRMSDWLSAEIKSIARLVCFCTDSGPLTGDNVKDIFKRGYSKPRMWAQYGQSHAGVCMIFKSHEFLAATRERFTKDQLRAYGNVQYANRSVVPDFFSSDDHPYLIDLESYEEVGKERYLMRHIAA